ncbi:hypothetical protein [Saccharolobus islandicus]|uniref:Uncharacterized protein n=1 Tax=Saccharolobus islandicus (strain REY15A) TaxID=930945 RepID=F0NFT0_SACI5|nr:hypothetical protein [Sulfolobus islandicus]ADX86466.1 hypothetical protein SiRe_2418 [Sulfolobus islandicus REY15A]
MQILILSRFLFIRVPENIMRRLATIILYIIGFIVSTSGIF